MTRTYDYHPDDDARVAFRAMTAGQRGEFVAWLQAEALRVDFGIVPEHIVEAVAGLLWSELKTDREHPNDRVHTGWGTKTRAGLAACVMRVAFGGAT